MIAVRRERSPINPQGLAAESFQEATVAPPWSRFISHWSRPTGIGLTRAAGFVSGEASSSDEMQLVQRSQGGDPEAFSALMDRYRERIVRLGVHMVGNRDDAQDLCQETFVRVYRALGTFDRRRAFSPWLYRIAHNVILDFLRRRKARPQTVESDDGTFYDSVDPSAENPQGALLTQEAGREALDAIRGLPDNYRSVVVFRYLDDLSYAEIAETLGITEANVMMRMSRARRMLRDRLKHLQIEDESR